MDQVYTKMPIHRRHMQQRSSIPLSWISVTTKTISELLCLNRREIQEASKSDWYFIALKASMRYVCTIYHPSWKSTEEYEYASCIHPMS